MKHYSDLGFISLGIVLIIAILFAFFIAGCNGPRSATMCLKNGEWIKCPKGIEAGTILDKKDYK